MLDKFWLARGAAAVGLLSTNTQLHANSFVDDSALSIGLKNFYVDRDFKQDDGPQSRIGSWTQGFTFTLNSGYTEGLLGFGVDVYSQTAVRLDGGGGRGPDSIIPYSTHRHEQASEYGRTGVAAKMKLSRTELRFGELRPKLPVVHIEESRQLSTSFSG